MQLGVSSGLCERCEHGQVMRSDYGHEETWCFNTHPARTLTFPVSSCTGYEQKGRMSEYDAKKIGWVLERKIKVTGFEPDESPRFVPPKRKDDDD